MHAGYVGEGMLTAVVCGGLFASPSIDAVLTAILHVAGRAGVLLIVKAYTGDCLNFGLAVERAKSMGVLVDMVIFSDDIAIPDHPRPRGLAGTVLLHKILGFYAQKMVSLDELKSIAESVKARISTLGVSITSCSLPNSSKYNRIAGGHAELGLGIHGEPGVEILQTQNATEILKIMTDRLRAKRTGPLAVLMNNLGGVSELEMSILCESFLKIPGIETKVLIGPAPLCTSLDMKGFSLTFLELKDSEFEDALIAPVKVHGWVQPIKAHTPVSIPPRGITKRLEFIPSANANVERILRTITDTLIAHESDLNQLDALVGDGDTGTTFATGAREILSSLDRLPLNDLSALFTNIGEILSRWMGGSAGVLLAIASLQTGRQLADGKTLAESLRSGLNQMMKLGGAGPGMRTMIDALVPAVDAMGEGWNAIAQAARAGAEATKSMGSAGAGRSSYLNSETLIGHADPGATAISIVFQALAA
jgi:dihydroxyacetone kinase